MIQPHRRLRIAGFCATLAALSTMMAAPAAAATTDLKPIVKKFTNLGYTCATAKPIGGYREANCYKGESYVHAVAFTNTTVYKTWAPNYCDLGSVPGFVTNGRSWIVDSQSVPLKSLRKTLGTGTIKKCPA